MKNIAFTIVSVILINSFVYGQADSVKEPEPRYFYLAVNFNAMVNTVGTFNKRISPSVEFGHTFGIFDLGLAGGKLNMIKNDSSYFLEIRPTINIFSKGRFSEALCLAGGYKFHSSQSFMTEICNSINFNVSDFWSVSVLQGYYYFDGTYSNSNSTFFGINVTHNFIKKNGKVDQRKRRSLLN